MIEEHSAGGAAALDRGAVERAFAFSCERHADQRRKSGEDFITHPVEVAKICAGLRLDTETLCAALLHDTVEDTSASIDEVREEFGETISQLVDGVTKLTEITFQSRDEHQAENYRKMMVAMATRRPGHPDQARRPPPQHAHARGAAEAEADREGARDARDLRAARPPPRDPRDEVGARGPRLPARCTRASTTRSRSSSPSSGPSARATSTEAGEFLASELRKVGIEAQISGRAKHFYSIYSKMTKKGREFNEIYDLTAMRVIVDSVKDCYGAIGIIHSLWKPLPGRFKDFIATPKLNLYQALHTTVIGPEGRPLEIQIRTPDMHETAEYGIAAHVIYKEIPERARPSALAVTGRARR